MALVSDVLTYARQLAQTDNSGLTDTAGLAFCNDALQNITRSMFARNIDAAQTQEAYTNLTTNNPNTYLWPANMYALKTIEVNFTDQQQMNYLQATEVEVANIQNNSFDWLRVNQDTSFPLFDNHGDTFEIFPIPPIANANGIKIFYYLTPTEYATTSSSIVYPQSLDYRCLAARVAALYAISVSDMNQYQVASMEYDKRLHDLITILAPASQQPIKPQKLIISGWQY
jgi:hypothetical protein